MHNHQIKKCSSCDTVISQCRCMDKNKTVIYELCEECKKKQINAMDKTKMSDRAKLIERLKRIFPGLELYYHAELFNNEEDCAPGYDISWGGIIEELEKNGLKIVEGKEKK